MNEKTKDEIKQQGKLSKTISYILLSWRVLFRDRSKYMFLWILALFLPSIMKIAESFLWSETVNSVAAAIKGSNGLLAVIMVICMFTARVGYEGLESIKGRAFDKLARESDRKMTLYAMERTLNIKQEDYDIASRYEQVKRALISQLSLWNLNWQTTNLFSSVIIAVLSVIITARYNPILSITVLPISLVVFIVNLKVSKIDRTALITDRKNQSMVLYLESLFLHPEYLKEIMVFREADRIIDEWEKNIDNKIKDKMRFGLRKQSMLLVTPIMEVLYTLFVYIIVALDACKGIISVGDFFLYTVNYLLLFGAISDCCGAIRELIIMSDDYDTFVDFTMATSDGERNGEAMQTCLFNSIQFSDVSFSYGDREVLHNLCFAISKGDKIALFGANGSGKTTLAKLICGLYDTYQGSIYYNGEDIRKYAQNEVYKKVGIVFQDFCHYQMRLREVVASHKIDEMYNDRRISDVLNACGLSQITERMKDGFDTILGREFDDNGIELSGGQWQKIAISRNIFGDRPLFIFDESSASLDSFSENLYLNTMFNANKNKTIILISHRMSIGPKVDRIIYMKDGRIVEQGTHGELIEKNGFYAEAYATQLEMYRQGGSII